MNANDAWDDDEQQEPQESTLNDPDPAVITAAGLGVDGEHGPLFSGIDLALAAGFHAIQMPGGPGQNTFLLTLAGRFKPTHGTLTVLGETHAARDPPALRDRGLRRHRRAGGIRHRADRARRATAVAGAVVLASARDAGGAELTTCSATSRRRPPRHTSSNCRTSNCFCCESPWRRCRIVRFWWSATSSRCATTHAGARGGPARRDRPAAHRRRRGDQPARLRRTRPRSTRSPHPDEGD